MNERIRTLLLDQRPYPVGYIGNFGRVVWEDNTYPQLGDELYAGVDLNKFAELIVKECAQVANDSNQSKNRAPGVSVGDVVRKHFGVGS